LHFVTDYSWPKPIPQELAMSRLLLVLAGCGACTTLSAASKNVTEPWILEQWIVGEWQVQNVPYTAITWTFSPDGKATFSDGKTTRKGTYTTDCEKQVIEFSEECDDAIKTESFAILFPAREHILMCPLLGQGGYNCKLKKPQFLP
jgi:hypothetical protein